MFTGMDGNLGGIINTARIAAQLDNDNILG